PRRLLPRVAGAVLQHVGDVGPAPAQVARTQNPLSRLLGPSAVHGLRAVRLHDHLCQVGHSSSSGRLAAYCCTWAWTSFGAALTLYCSQSLRTWSRVVALKISSMICSGVARGSEAARLTREARARSLLAAASLPS